MLEVFKCLSCNRENPVRGANYTNKYCNNYCQQQHRKKLLNEKRIREWKAGCGLFVWKEVPDYIKEYLIQERGHCCQVCNITEWMGRPAPLTITQVDHNIYNNSEENLVVLCANCLSQK
jgi:hypothetical protein